MIKYAWPQTETKFSKKYCVMFYWLFLISLENIMNLQTSSSTILLYLSICRCYKLTIFWINITSANQEVYEHWGTCSLKLGRKSSLNALLGSQQLKILHFTISILRHEVQRQLKIIYILCVREQAPFTFEIETERIKDIL